MFEPLGMVFSRILSSANDVHEEILGLIREQDAEGARAAMSGHIMLTRSSSRITYAAAHTSLGHASQRRDLRPPHAGLAPQPTARVRRVNQMPIGHSRVELVR
jgi:hypothetical protein